MNNSDLLVDSYDYNLPKELIATYPITPRDAAKLLVYNRKTDTITHTVFRNILDFTRDDSFIFNDTKVLKARIFGHKQTGGRVELLLNSIFQDKFLVYIRGKVKVGSILEFDQHLTAKVKELNDDGSRVVEFYQHNNKLDFTALLPILQKIGHVPLPPYINRSDEELDEVEYQTIFAKNYGAVAAPTASLHFTKELLEQIPNKHFLTLHVGAGTFKPVDVDNILQHKMHSEFFEIPQQTADILDSSQSVVAVGTTSTRTIEYYARYKQLSGECDLFLHPQNPPIRVNKLLTNFHLPKSTLIMLVSAFIGRDKTLALYEEAIRHKYRFYSYGDAMLII
ncbi:MAG: tRNA preQ1(34) S-adenosylmethionine ribosyltransferase-isomerase QueA [Epsilonproteobacteria bacterium]|nr:tRNA preQ1(34) S-adenosylmethionine ribosyltransferase-isomerase QueA [Campylobacterota bacterium]